MGLKMALKWPKTLQMSWNLDQTCIFMSFIKFKKNFGKIWKLANFWPINGHLARVLRRFFNTHFYTVNVSSLWKMLLSLPNWVYMYPKVSSTIFRVQNFDFLSSSWKKLGFVDLGGRFWGFLAKNGPLGPRNPIFFSLNSKNQNSVHEIL